MGWFRASGTVEILNVRWLFIPWWSKEGQVYWWIKLQNCVRLRRKKTSKFFVGISSKKRKFIIHPEFFDANNIISDPFIENLKRKPNMVHDLLRQMNTPQKKWLENSVKHQIHQILRITRKNGKHNTVEGHMQKMMLY